MAAMNTPQMIKRIPKIDGSNFVEWARSSHDILQTTWPLLRKLESGLERPESTPRENIEGKKNTKVIVVLTATIIILVK